MSKILIIDDNLELVQLVKYRLEKNNFQVIEAYDGEEGIQCALQFCPDLIIMDVQMPKVPGIAAVKRLQLDDRTKNIPIIFLTGLMANLNHGEKTKIVNVDGKDFIAFPKPFNTDCLLLEIQKLLRVPAI